MELIITTRGASLSVKEGKFVVRTPEDTTDVVIEKIKTIVLHRSTKLTYEVVRQAIQSDIDIIFADKQGYPIGRVWGNKFGSISTIRKNQLHFAEDDKLSTQFIKEILISKVRNQAMILSVLEHKHSITVQLAQAIAKINSYAHKIEQYTNGNRSERHNVLRAYEGKASDIYFKTISLLLPFAYQFEKRSRQPAHDMFNCMLNYCYGMLYAQVESALIHAGIDPYLGIFHRDEYNRPVLTYDVIERYRHWADFVVIELCMQQAAYREMFDNTTNTFFLNHEGKKLIIPAMNDYMDEVIEINRNMRTRMQHMRLHAQALAQVFKESL